MIKSKQRFDASQERKHSIGVLKGQSLVLNYTLRSPTQTNVFPLYLEEGKD
jgi:hypothetical protein